MGASEAYGALDHQRAVILHWLGVHGTCQRQFRAVCHVTKGLVTKGLSDRALSGGLAPYRFLAPIVRR